MTKKMFIAESRNPELAKAVITQFGGWVSFKESAPDVASRGISGGFTGWCWYSETLPFFSRNRVNIKAALQDLSVGCGQTVIESVKSFNGLDATEDEIEETLAGGEVDIDVANVLAWFAAETICIEFQELLLDTQVN